MLNEESLMEDTPRIKRMAELMHRRPSIYMALVPVARAAANQMADAGMRMGSSPLLEAIGRIDTLEEDLKTLFAGDGIDMEAVQALDNLLKRMEAPPDESGL